MSKKVLIGLVASLSFVFLASCGDKKDAPASGGGTAAKPSASPSDGPEVKLDPATAGTIKGKVTFGNQPDPMPTVVQMGDKTGECGTADKPVVDEWYVAGENNAAAHVLVFVKNGPAKNVRTPVPSTEVVLDQVNCMYTPRTLGMRAGQPLRVKSSDNTVHNIHVFANANEGWNQSMNPKSSFLAGEGNSKPITLPEVVKVKCDVHTWMSATIGAFNHDAFAVTKKDGLFELKNLPPGEYEIEVKHERAKGKTQKVTVGAKETKDLNFEIKFDN